jgi:lipase chaperone LimK
MKKVIYSVAVAATFLIVSCGPSAEEIAKKEAARMDSIAKVTSDSLAAIEAQKQQMMQDSINAAMEKMRQDSILAAEEAAAAKKKGGSSKPKTKPEPKKDDKQIGGLKKDGGTPDKIIIGKKTGAK